MKKVFACLLMLLILMCALSPAYAMFENPSISDEAGYLTERELSKLTQKLDKVREKYNFEVAIYTEKTMTSETAEASADDIYDYMGYGGGENDDGIMLYICSDSREYHFTTHGKGLEYFNQNALIYLEGRVLPYLRDNDYSGAFGVYIKTADELLMMAENGTPYNERQYGKKYVVGVVAVCFIAPVLIAFFMMKNKLKKMKTAVQNDYAANYIKPGSMKIAVSRDMFLFSRVSKTEKAKSTSGTHISSSGRTHGGRGGSF